MIVNPDFEEDEQALLGTYIDEASDERDPRKRYVVRFRYKGEDPENEAHLYLQRVLIKKNLIEGGLDFTMDDIIAVIRLTGSKETDVCLASEKAYRMFWSFCKTVQRINPTMLEKFDMIPLFRGDVKVLTVAFRTTTIPAQDVEYWVSKYAKVLKGPDKNRTEEGFWNGEYRCVVSFKNAEAEGKIPKYFFLGGDRGVTRYSGQPQACFQCGSYTHHRRICTTPLCSRCGERGHLSAACRKSICCNLCGEQGHTYFWCPKAFYNRQDIERFEQVRRKAEMGKQRAERETSKRRPERTADGGGEGSEARGKEAPVPEGEGREEQSDWRVIDRQKGRGRSGQSTKGPDPAPVPAEVTGQNKFSVLQEEMEREEEQREITERESSESMETLQGQGRGTKEQEVKSKEQRQKRVRKKERERGERRGQREAEIQQEESVDDGGKALGGDGEARPVVSPDDLSESPQVKRSCLTSLQGSSTDASLSVAGTNPPLPSPTLVLTPDVQIIPALDPALPPPPPPPPPLPPGS